MAAHGGRRWTEKDKALVRELHQDGEKLTVRQLAERFGVSKNAMLGVLHRMGISSAARNPVRRLPPAERARRERLADPDARAALPAPRVSKRGLPRLAPASEVAARHARVTSFRTCQWIEGAPGPDERCKCGAPAVPGAPYCTEHQARAWQGVKASERLA